MNSHEFCEFAKAAIEYIACYLDNVRNWSVLPYVQPGYLKSLIPAEAPKTGESWQDILRDFDRVIMPGITHWHSPHFHAYYPTAHSFPAVVGDIISAGIACNGFNWMVSPACTELEVAMMNWLGKLLNLPKQFLNCSGEMGKGVLQGSASESTLICLLAAREKTVKTCMKLNPNMDEKTIRSKLVAYTSEHSNSSVEKAGLLGSVPMRLLTTNNFCQLQGDALEKAIDEDRKIGLIPCYVVATFGTTGTCAFDNLEEIGPLCNKKKIWLHVDAAYAGAALSCPEFRCYMPGVKFADSFCFNPHKWMLVNSDCSALWVKNTKLLTEAFKVDRNHKDEDVIHLSHEDEGMILLNHEDKDMTHFNHEGEDIIHFNHENEDMIRLNKEDEDMLHFNHEDKDMIPEYRHWQIPVGRRFRALKMWFVLRVYGAEGIRKNIRDHVGFAKYFENLVANDDRFEVVTSVLGMVCFRMKGDNMKTKELSEKLMARKNIYVITAMCNGNLLIRFVVCSRLTEKKDIDFAWREIYVSADEVLADFSDIQGCANL